MCSILLALFMWNCSRCKNLQCYHCISLPSSVLSEAEVLCCSVLTISISWTMNPKCHVLPTPFAKGLTLYKQATCGHNQADMGICPEEYKQAHICPRN